MRCQVVATWSLPGVSFRHTTSQFVENRRGCCWSVPACSSASGQNAAGLDLGFRTDELLLVSVDPLAQGYAPEQALGFYEDVANEVAALPEVRSVSWARVAPQAPGPSRSMVTLDGPATDRS